MAKLLPCPFCGGEAVLESYKARKGYEATIQCNGGCILYMNTITYDTEEEAIEAVIKRWNTRTPKEREADKPKITCLNCKHLMFSDMYGECKKQLKIVNPSDTCEYAERKRKEI